MTITATWSSGAAAATWALLAHGGAGDLDPSLRDPAREGCRTAVAVGAAILAAGGSALDAAEAVVRALEDDPRFNAGTGSALDEEGRLALDASIMEGRGLRAGAVCVLPAFRHPIAIARAALEDGQHVLYAADGAARFALSRGFERADEAAMITEGARRRWREVRDGVASAGWAGGTVGCVARDASGLVVAATSTGGTSNKRVGRVGDTPIPGAGTWADDEAGAASNTGHGEGVIRTCLGHWAVERMRAGDAPDAAAAAAIARLGARAGASGGIILADRHGRLGLARSTGAMSWAAAWAGGDADGV